MKTKKTLFSLIILYLIFLLASCVPTNPIISVEIDKTTIPESAMVNEFDITQVYLFVEKSDGTSRIQVTTSMVKESDLNKLLTVGEQSIQIKYLNYVRTFKITILPPSDSVIIAALQKDRELLIVPNEVEENFTLPLRGENGSFITWSSNKEEFKIDQSTGFVTLTRPPFERGDLEVELRATLLYYSISIIQDFDVVIIAFGQDEIASQMDRVASSLVVPNTISDTLSLNFTSSEYEELVINWTSSHPTIININNQTKTVKVIKPEYDTIVSLSFEIKYRGQTFTGYQDRKVTVIGDSPNIVAPAVTNLRIIGDVLSWDEVDGALNYKVYVNGALKATTSTSLLNLSNIITEKGFYQIGVQTMAFGEYLEDAKIVFINYSISLYDGNYYKTANLGLLGNALKIELRALLTTTQTRNTTYENLKTDIQYTDEDLSIPGNIILFYSRISIKSTWVSGGTTWNREHVWPQSLGWFQTSGAGSDLHHIRPTDPSVNSSRGNKLFGDVTNGTRMKLGTVNGGAYIDCYYLGNYFNPTDEVKGDIARIIFFLFTRYYQSDSFDFNRVSQSLSVLLRWHYLDPVDESEMVRNNRIAEKQGNRNPFIDYPDLADRIWQ